METNVLTYSITVSQPALEVDAERAHGQETEYGIGLSQPSLVLEQVPTEELSQTDILSFGRWFKGDKGDKGDPGTFDYDIATNEEIDMLFEL